MNSYIGQSVPLAAVNAWPTTTSGITLWNGEKAGGKVYIVDALSAFLAQPLAAATMLSLARMMNVGKIVKPTTGTKITPISENGDPAYAGLAYCYSGVTVVNDGWYGIGTSLAIPFAANTNGLVEIIPPKGKFVIKPGFAFSFHAMTTVVPNSVELAIAWHESTMNEAQAL